MASSDYGALSSNFPCEDPSKKFYISTAISYTNGYPHIGHAYEFVSADVIARFHRLLGYNTFFLTGSDEHGQKVAAAAAKNNKSPKEHCDHYVASFQELDKKLKISYDRFIRTTDDDHVLTSQKLWLKCAENDDIYLSSYVGWYNEREECFVTDADAEASNFLDSSSGVPLKRVEEESYFFRMSKYCEKLIAHIEANPEFIQPEMFRNNILARLTKEGLKDLSISRTSFDWGIPVPNDPRHVMYVWFDALTNYLSGVQGLNPEHELSSFWPATLHIIGKDIIWFHCVIWPCMLMSANVPLPKCVFAHGFINASDGRKMSKSFNNTVDPFEILSAFSLDTIRYYMCSTITYGADLNFSIPHLKTIHNTELGDILGNLVHRVLALCLKFCDGKVPDVTHVEGTVFPFELTNLVEDVTNDVVRGGYCIHSAIFKAMEAARGTNKYLTEAEPWKLKGDENNLKRQQIVRTAMELVYAFMHFLAPAIPIAAQQFFDKLHTPPKPAHLLRSDFLNLVPGTPVELGEILFTKFEAEDAAEKKPVVPVKKEVKKPVVEDPNQADVMKLEFKVGKIVKIYEHESSDKLFVEEIDVGEASPRQVVSGLRHHYSASDLDQKLVVLLCNIKEAKLAGVVSNGLVLTAASAEGKVEILEPPVDSVIGDRVIVEGMTGPAFEPNKVKKLKLWDVVKPGLHVNDEGVFCHEGKRFISSQGGVCRANLIVGSPVM